METPDINPKGRRFPTRIDVPAAARERLIDQLNQQVVNTSDLRSQIKQAHWNVKGKGFYLLHLLYDEIAEELDQVIDGLAERASALGGYATGTVRAAAEVTQIPELPTDVAEGTDTVRAVAERLGLYANLIRHAIDDATKLGDLSTADLYTEISRAVDKRLWFLEAHLQAQG
jgi:starvation-inducible DNA-binding protein